MSHSFFGPLSRNSQKDNYRQWTFGLFGHLGFQTPGPPRSPCSVISTSESDFRSAPQSPELLVRISHDAVISYTARVGGNDRYQSEQAHKCSDNLEIAHSVINGIHLVGVDRLVYVVSSATYPADAPMPLRREKLLVEAPDPAHMGNAVVKRAEIALFQSVAGVAAGLRHKIWFNPSHPEGATPRSLVVTRLKAIGRVGLEYFKTLLAEAWDALIKKDLSLVP